MGDERWRVAERRWLADRSDRLALEEAIQARRRAGVRVPGRMLLERFFPARTFDCRLALDVFIEARDGSVRKVGRTPSKKDGPIRIPEHRTWWVNPNVREGRALLKRTLGIVRKEQIPGLEIVWPRWVEKDFDLVAKEAPHLTRFALDADYSWGSDEDRPVTLGVIAAIARLPALERLAIVMGEKLGTQLAPLRDRAELVELTLGVPILTPEALAMLPPNLHRLALNGSDHNHVVVEGVDHGLEGVATLHELAELDLAWSDASDAGIARFIARVDPGRLERLGVGRCPGVTGKGLAGIERLVNLRHLDLGRTRIDDACLAHVARLPALESLKLDRCLEITDKGVASLGRMKSLRELILDNSPRITSKGLGKLEGLDRLERLYVEGSATTRSAQAAGRKRLAKALPDCKIV
jgi:hypothetical protein